VARIPVFSKAEKRALERKIVADSSILSCKIVRAFLYCSGRHVEPRAIGLAL
jgi:hypothetical protein